MGRKKIQIRRIDTEKKRTVTFNKRRAGVIKKAMELSILCDSKVAVIIMDNNDEAAVYSSTGSDDIIQQVTVKKPVRILDNQDYNTLFGDNIDEESATALERFRALMGSARAENGAHALVNALAAGIPESTGRYAVAPNPLQALQQQILVHTAMQIGTNNASNTAQQALQALQLIQAMNAQSQPQAQQPPAATAPAVAAAAPLATPGTQQQQSSPTFTAAQVAQIFTPLFTPGGMFSGFSSLSPENQPSSGQAAENADGSSTGIPSPTFQLPLPTPGISAQLAELTALIAANTSTGSGNTPTGTPGPPSLNTSPSLTAPLTEVPSLSPSTGPTNAEAFAIPLAPAKAHASSSATAEMGPPTEPLSASANSKRMSLTVSIPVENQFLSALLAQSNQQAIIKNGGANPAAAGSSSSVAASDAAPAVSVGVAPESNVVASATMPENRPLMTPSDWATQATPGATNWLLPQQSPMNLPMLTPGFTNTPSSAPFLSFPMFSPKH